MTTITDNSIYAQLGLTGSAQSSSSSNTLGQEDFLELMITQIQNQDPFNPQDSGDFLAQLASFGTVDGIQSLQTSMDDLATSLTSNQALQASNLLGREVLFETSAMAFDGAGSMSGAVALPHSATDVTVGVYSSSGELVRNVDLGAQSSGLVDFTWDGRNEAGELAPAGVYYLQAQASSGNSSEAVQVLGRANVDSVTLDTNGEALTIGIQDLGDIEISRVWKIS